MARSGPPRRESIKSQTYYLILAGKKKKKLILKPLGSGLFVELGISGTFSRAVTTVFPE